VRAGQPVLPGAHDTRAWIGLARDAGAFDVTATPFEDVQVLWSKGLLMAD
jgi:hypothetical protein